MVHIVHRCPSVVVVTLIRHLTVSRGVRASVLLACTSSCACNVRITIFSKAAWVNYSLWTCISNVRNHERGKMAQYALHTRTIMQRGSVSQTEHCQSSDGSMLNAFFFFIFAFNII